MGGLALGEANRMIVGLELQNKAILADLERQQAVVKIARRIEVANDHYARNQAIAELTTAFAALDAPPEGEKP